MSNSEGEPKPERIYFIDNLRIVLTILVVLRHQSIFYAANVLLMLFLMINQAFFMGLFFFLSGCFTPMSFDRKGSLVFLKDRLLRFGVPILLYLFVISPLAKTCMHIFQQQVLPSPACSERFRTQIKPCNQYRIITN